MTVDRLRIDEIAGKYAMLSPMLDERQTRLWVAAEARVLGRGGIAAVTSATGILGKRIRMGMRELEELGWQPAGAASASAADSPAGAGRKQVTDTDPTLLRDSESLIDPVTRGGSRVAPSVDDQERSKPRRGALGDGAKWANRR